MFGHDSAPSRIYSYGAREPAEVAAVDAQMRAAHRYHNVLVALERARRADVDETLRAASPRLAAVETEIAEAEAAVETAVKALQRAQAAARKKVRPAALVEPVAAARARLKLLRAERKTLRAELFAAPEWIVGSAAINETTNVKQRFARAASGLYWGTYLMVEASLSGARSGAPPRFAPWRGDGHLAVQLQHGLSVEALLAGTDARLRMMPVPAKAWLPGGRHLRKTTVWFRIGSDSGRAAIWATVPIVLHRPIPEDAAIKWAHLIRRRIGCHCEWRLQLVLSREAGWAPKDHATGGMVGIDVGWRLRPTAEPGTSALRVAYWVGDDGAEGELLLDAEWLGGMRQVENLRSIRDQNLNGAKNDLAAGLSALGPQLPDWLREATATLHAWRAQARLAALAIRWRTARFEGDAGAFDALEAWRKQDKHLLEWEANSRDRLQGLRHDTYRVFAAQMRRRYGTIVLEVLDLRSFHKLPAPEEAARDGALTEHVRDACLSDLRQCLIESGGVIEAPAQYTTMDCASCGSRERWDASALTHRCSRCAAIYDQDRNAALNLMRAGVRGLELVADGGGRS